MLLGGLWHGASWTFIIWGGLHGLYLIINHAWRKVLGHDSSAGNESRGGLAASAGYAAITLLAVVVAWVFFRAPTLDAAVWILKSMARFPSEMAWGVTTRQQAAWLAVLLLWVLFAPNTNKIMSYRFGSESIFEGNSHRLRWKLSSTWAALAGAALFATALVGIMQRDKLEFLYFQF